MIAAEIGPVTAMPPRHQMAPGEPPMDLGYMIGAEISLTATHTFLNAPALDILLVPGGIGNVVLAQHNDSWIEDFVGSRYPTLDYVLSVCTGSMSLAKAGVLNGKRATTNKAAWGSVTTLGENVTWVPSARWTEDEKVWTSSGVAAGMYNLIYVRDDSDEDRNGYDLCVFESCVWV
jgi:putative intracellular protease/amidase